MVLTLTPEKKEKKKQERKTAERRRGGAGQRNDKSSKPAVLADSVSDDSSQCVSAEKVENMREESRGKHDDNKNLINWGLRNLPSCDTSPHLEQIFTYACLGVCLCVSCLITICVLSKEVPSHMETDMY